MELALETANLLNAVSCDLDDITVFAPTDMAFGKLGDLGTTLLEDPGWVLHLENTLLKHVVDSVIFAMSIKDGQTITPLSEETITANVHNNVCFEPGNACVEMANVEADNGIAHVVDSVILPNWASTTIADVVISSAPEFSILLDLLICSSIDVGVLQDVTVFAPTNDAFHNLFDDTGLSIHALCNDLVTLDSVLRYHVLGAVVPSVLLDTVNTPTTLEGSPVTIINCGSDSLSINDGSIVSTDILTNQGIIHVIDTVLLPGTAPEPPSDSKNSKKSSYSVCH